MQKKRKGTYGIIIALIVMICILSLGGLGLVGILLVNYSPSHFSTAVITSEPADSSAYIARLSIEGNISSYDMYGMYDHQWTLDQIDFLMDDEYNQALLLYINSPGGNIYESDELYLKLLEYKETTGRPIYAYMAQEAASGGFLAAMAADEIYASRMTITGSIGVLLDTYNISQYYEEQGIFHESITSGENKDMGMTKPLTDEQREIYQAIVDEMHQYFIQAVAESRDLSENQVEEIADGRIYSAQQALDLGLIDGLCTYDSLESQLLEEYGLESDGIWDLGYSEGAYPTEYASY